MLSPLGFSVLRLLSDGELHSGEALAATAGVTRARVSQVLQDAVAAGLKLERVRGRGYRLVDALPFLERDAVIAALGPMAAKLAVEIVDTIDSTNSELARRAARVDIHRRALAAEWQTAGRGRRGRNWTAIAGGSLTFSFGWRFEQGAGHLAGLTLAVGLSLAQSLEAAGLAGIGLKWPNDLTHDGAKLGGILVELSGDALGPSIAIIGVGVNVRLSPDARRAIEQPATDLSRIPGARSLDRNLLLARMLVGLATMLEAYASEGFAPLRAAWQRRHVLHDRPVEVRLPDGGVARGRVAGVDADGALVLDSASRRLRLVSGEVSQTRARR